MTDDPAVGRRRYLPSAEDVYSYIVNNMVVLIFIVVAAGIAFASPLFLTSDNLVNVLRQVSVVIIISAGFTLALGAGEIDLSVGAVMGLSGVLAAKAMAAGVPVVLACLLAMVVGVGLGLFNGFLVNTFRINSLIATIATGGVYRGAIYLITNTKPVSGLPKSFVKLGQGTWLHLPIQVFVMAACVFALFVVVNRTPFGRRAIAIGGNREAAVVTGVSTTRVRLGVYAVLGACAALAGLLQTARSASAQVSAGDGIELDAIAAVVIGGTSLFGGTSRVIGSVFGCLIVGMVGNGLNLLAINANWQVVAKGSLILIAVILDSSSSRVLTGIRTRSARKGRDEPGRTLVASIREKVPEEGRVL